MAIFIYFWPYLIFCQNFDFCFIYYKNIGHWDRSRTATEIQPQIDDLQYELFLGIKIIFLIKNKYVFLMLN